MESEMKTSCPDEEMLVDYLEGRLSEKDRSLVEEHLSDCQTCLESLVITRDIAKEADRFELEPVPNKITESAVRLVTGQAAVSRSAFAEKLQTSVKDAVSRISDTFQFPAWGGFQPVLVRGSKVKASEDLICVKVSFEGIETQIEVEKAGDNKALIRVKVQKRGEQGKALRVTLKEVDREIASYVLEETYVVFEDIPFGHYSISLAENGVELGAYLFEIKDTRHPE
jgi:hypothetical protein